LVIEVSVSSLRRDLVRKPSLYAASGVDEYWVIDLDGRRVVIHRDPGSDGYADVAEVHTGAELVPAGLGIGGVTLDGLLRAATV
jgi:Uma2 family endonuclease